MLMRSLMWCVCILFTMAVTARAGSYFVDAGEAYGAGKFEQAKRIYEEGLRTNADATMLINHGNSCFRLGEPGLAILSYERALVASPSHPDAAENLKFVRTRAGSRVAEPDWRERTLAAMPRRIAPWLAMTAAWVGYTWIAIALARRRGVIGVIAGGLLVTLGASYAAGIAWMEARLAQAAIIVVAKADARNEPTDRATLAESLPAGSRVRVLGDHGAWTFCELPSGTRGWLPAGTVERIFAAGR